MSGFPRFFGFRVFLSDGSSKTLQKTLYKKSRRKEITKKNDQKSKTDFSRFVHQVFGRYSVRGVQKHHTKYRKKEI
jgi:hypothetical protein